ncbi:DUF177 domain-containing protein [Alkalihalobacillus oceani]|uniref:YceD family protein n=1 Tax=Halalkalibacter oceani TaxID=1653776 RepID=UPI00203D7B18|nr:DUF177 domain-containing protein [Halalkalibacter oceani]MCM3759334.1 DUF177 domain-containing protein [Halalkalibacter oceani]
MKWSLQQLQAAKHKPFTFEETVDLTSLKEQNAEIRAVSPIDVRGEVTFSRSLWTFKLHLSGELILPCARTLADVRFPIDLNVSERFHPSADEWIADEEDDDIHPIEGESIDLLPYVKERILLEIPIQVYADDEAQRQAPPSGTDWELVTEEQQKNRIDPRLADLAKFFDKE